MQRLYVIVAGLVLTCSTLGCRGYTSEKPPVHLILNMDSQEKVKAYSADNTGLFADGRGMRMPPEGTIARGTLDEDLTWTQGLASDAGTPSIKFPERFTIDDHTRASGKMQYHIHCSPCHGTLGDGQGAVALKGGLLVPPPDLAKARQDLTLGQIYSAIANGVNKPNMASYASQIPVAERWAIVLWVRELQKEAGRGGAFDAAPAPLEKVDMSKPSVAYGQQLYKTKNCYTCHSIDGSKLVGPSYKGLFGKIESTDKGSVTIDEASLKESILDPMAKITVGYAPAMPVTPVNEIEVNSLILYIKSLK